MRPDHPLPQGQGRNQATVLSACRRLPSPFGRLIYSLRRKYCTHFDPNWCWLSDPSPPKQMGTKMGIAPNPVVHWSCPLGGMVLYVFISKSHPSHAAVLMFSASGNISLEGGRFISGHPLLLSIQASGFVFTQNTCCLQIPCVFTHLG